MIDKAVVGGEFELELKDKNDNITIICSIENMDPGFIQDSITVLRNDVKQNISKNA